MSAVSRTWKTNPVTNRLATAYPWRVRFWLAELAGGWSGENRSPTVHNSKRFRKSAFIHQNCAAFVGIGLDGALEFGEEWFGGGIHFR